jgi:hypothetical protein
MGDRSMYVDETFKIINSCNILIRKSRWNRPPERLKHGSEDNIKMGLSKIGFGPVTVAERSEA